MRNMILSTQQLLGEVSALPCCVTGFAHGDCDAVDVMSTDPLYSTARITCVPHARSLPAPRSNCGFGPREQANQVSSYLDASAIYGSSQEELQRLRASGSAKLTSSSVPAVADNLLPFDPATVDYCQSQHPKRKCFQSGTTDANLLPGIAVIHTLWHREHNRIAEKLKV